MEGKLWPGTIDKFVEKNNFPCLLTWKDGDDRNLLPYIAIRQFNNLPTAKWEKMHKEIQKLEDEFIVHRKYEKHVGWESLCLFGLSSVHVGSHGSYGFSTFNEKNHWTDVSDFVPYTKEFVLSMGFSELSRVRIMKIKLGGYLLPHYDSEIKATGAVNVSIYTPITCKFYIDGFGYLPFGSYQHPDMINDPHVICPNNGYYHCVQHKSTLHDLDRYHLIIDGKKSKEFYELEDENIRYSSNQ